MQKNYSLENFRMEFLSKFNFRSRKKMEIPMNFLQYFIFSNMKDKFELQ